VLDPLLTFLCFNVLIYWLGCGIIGPSSLLISKDLVAKYLAQGIITDVWTVNNEAEINWLLSLKTIVTTDFMFDEYHRLRAARDK
jgi:hypothetical protein